MSTPISPKVTSGATWTTIATLALAFLNSVTPDALGALGKWEPLVNGLVTLAAFGIGAYLKEDPLRTAGSNAPGIDLKEAVATLRQVLPDKSQAPFIPAALAAKTADVAPVADPVVVPEPTVPADPAAAPAPEAPAA